jgi:hypothetical protein
MHYTICQLHDLSLSRASYPNSSPSLRLQVLLREGPLLLVSRTFNTRLVVCVHCRHCVQNDKANVKQRLEALRSISLIARRMARAKSPAVHSAQ